MSTSARPSPKVQPWHALLGALVTQCGRNEWSEYVRIVQNMCSRRAESGKVCVAQFHPFLIAKMQGVHLAFISLGNFRNPTGSSSWSGRHSQMLVVQNHLRKTE